MNRILWRNTCWAAWSIFKRSYQYPVTPLRELPKYHRGSSNVSLENAGRAGAVNDETLGTQKVWWYQSNIEFMGGGLIRIQCFLEKAILGFA